MKVVAFNGSARKKGNTDRLLRAVLEVLEAKGIRTELVSLAGLKLQGCIACYQCFERKDRRCAVENDDLNACIAKMLEADGILLGSPTYFADVSAGMKALIERSGMVARANGDMLQRKVGAGVVAVRRAGAAHVFSSLNYFFLIGQMVVPGSSYWNIGIGKDPGEVADDAEGLRTMRTLGENMAWVLERLHGAP
ncbi:flavodoxin family protein [Dissulfurirhabdus thermomarina]|uniref:Flavodoxin family protein n=1 Tax=Dissulfurirhabdus thermomarina TaxID=1765737 RepID=A0A6N9TJP0_DISTH|nr:flavodoxin family protein [Dissulfurirhabdus thermomarina]NDY41481.1 flavodoxin family protein [Dissulfurirhabdus thermomarina]NMX23892.1 flavodoxin family protein [Dissulfurirhabdus thermomarina]